MVFLDGAPDQRRYRGVLGVGEIDRRHDLAGSSALEAPRDDQSIMDTFMLLASLRLPGRHDGRRMA